VVQGLVGRLMGVAVVVVVMVVMVMVVIVMMIDDGTSAIFTHCKLLELANEE
jgi:lipopolysaccharide/colanic/teichoic acid biosynthesis glycosyltransferase